MANMFGRRNPWANGPPPGGGEGGGLAQGNRRYLGAGTGSADEAEKEAKKIIFQRKKKEDNRSLYHETLKRDSVKENNYMIFNIRDGEDQCSFEQLGGILLDLGVKPDEVTSINGNPYNQREIEVLLVENVEVDVATWSKKLDEKGFPLTVNKIGKLEEVFIIKNLPLTLNTGQMKSWINEAVKPFVSEINGVIPLKYSVNRIKDLPEPNKKFFEGKYDGSWRVSVTPKGTAEVPSFIAVGPDDMQGTVRYIKRGQPVDELCWSCYGKGHKKFDKEGDLLVCPGPKDWMEYVKDFKSHASNISGKTPEELFGFHESSVRVVQYERKLEAAVKELEETHKENEAKLREEASKEIEKEKEKIIQHAEKDLNFQLGKTTAEWKHKLDNLHGEMEVLKSTLEDKMEEESKMKLEMEAIRKENERLREKSTQDIIAIANLDSTNENLARMIAKGSTLDEEEGTLNIQVKSSLMDDPYLLETDLDLNEIQEQNRKHSLSPESRENGVSKVARSNSMSDQNETTISSLQLKENEKEESLPRSNSLGTKSSLVVETNETKIVNPPPPPPLPPRHKNKKLIQDSIVEMKTGKGKIQAKILSGHDKKNHFNVKIVKSEDKRYKVNDETVLDFSKTNNWHQIPPQQFENVTVGILKK